MGALLLAALPPALATAQQLLALDGELGDGVPGLVERILGEEAVIPIIILRKPESMVNPQDADDKIVLKATVMLSGGAIAAPLGDNFVFRADDGAAPHPALIRVSLTLPSPDTTKSITQIVTLYDARQDPKSKVASFTLRWVSAAECQAALKAAIAENARARSRELQICGALPGLREQLRLWKVPFEDLRDELPARLNSNIILVASEISEDDRIPKMEEGGSLLFFHQRPARGLEVLRKHDRICLTEVWQQDQPDWRHSALLLRLLTEHLQHFMPVFSP